MYKIFMINDWVINVRAVGAMTEINLIVPLMRVDISYKTFLIAKGVAFLERGGTTVTELQSLYIN